MGVTIQHAPGPIIAFGTYTPTLTNTTNIDSTTAVLANYYRIGDKVTVFGVVVVDPTAAAATEFAMSLPIASNFANSGDVGGSGAAEAVNEAWACVVDAANDRVKFKTVAVSTAAHNVYFNFSYRII